MRCPGNGDMLEIAAAPLTENENKKKSKSQQIGRRRRSARIMKENVRIETASTPKCGNKGNNEIGEIAPIIETDVEKPNMPPCPLSRPTRGNELRNVSIARRLVRPIRFFSQRILDVENIK